MSFFHPRSLYESLNSSDRQRRVEWFPSCPVYTLSLLHVYMYLASLFRESVYVHPVVRLWYGYVSLFYPLACVCLSSSKKRLSKTLAREKNWNMFPSSFFLSCLEEETQRRVEWHPYDKKEGEGIRGRTEKGCSRIQGKTWRYVSWTWGTCRQRYTHTYSETPTATTWE